MERDPKERAGSGSHENVLDITGRIPRRVSSISVRADIEARLVVQRFEAPPGSDVAAIEVGYELSQLVEMMTALLVAGAQLARETTSVWAGHIGVAVPGGRVAAEAFLRIWRTVRPAYDAHHSVDVVREAAYRCAEIAVSAAGLRNGVAGAFLQQALLHITYEGLALTALGPTCPGLTSGLGGPCASIPWNLPL